MKNIAQQLAELFERENRRKGRWRKVVTALAAVVVFVTTYALILPGITLEKDPVCGMEEHTHTADCYTQLTSVTKTALVCNAETLQIHQHTPDCYNEDGELVCGYADFVVHTHDENCYDENGSLVCTLPEIELHTHDESCYDADGNLICGKPEVTLHTHDSSCFDENGNLICKKLQVLEHHHSDTCFAEVEQPLDTTALTCTNTDPDHEHTALCYGTWVLTCDKPEHTHTDACYAAQDEDAADEETEEIPADEETEETLAAKPGIMLFEEGNGAESDNAANSTGDTDGAAPDGNGTDSTTSAQDDTRAVFGKYVKTVTYKDPTYNPETDQVEVSFGLTFAIGSSAMHPSEGGGEQHNFVYALPKGVTIPDSMLGKTYTGRDTSGAEGFTYSFVKNQDGTYSILIDFIHDYVKDKNNFEGYINFSAYAGATNEEESEHKYTFADDHVIDIKPEEIKHPEGESMHYNIAVDKSASSYNYDENKITYTVTVDSTKGTPNPLNLTDVLTLGDGLRVKEVKLGSVVREDRYDEWNMVYGSQKEIQNQSLSYDPTSGEITMSLPELGTGSEEKGQRYTITYDVYLNEPAAGSQYTVGNKATVSGTDSTKGETVKDSDETTTTVNKDLDLKKVGTYNKDTNTITWAITINSNRNNIAGSTLTDDMFASITDKSTVKFEPSNGIAWDGDALKFSGDNGEVNKNTYTITYTTPLPDDLKFTDGVAVANNKATVTPPSGEEKNAEASVTIDKTVDVGKKGEYDKSQNKIKWTITVNQNGNSLKNTVLTDTMFNQVKPNAIKVDPSTDGMTITENADGTIKKITFNESAGNRTYTITYYTDVPAPAEGEDSVEVKNGTTVTPPDLPPKTDEETVVVNKNVDFNKWGSYDKATDLITWTITVNKNGNDLTGKVLTDEMFSKFEDKNQITITPANGYEWNEDNLKFTAVENGVNNQTYTITYTTKSGVDVNKSDTVKNTVGLDGKKTTTEVPVDRTITFDKQNGSYDSNNKRIWWTIELNTNNQNIYNFVLTDKMFAEMVDDTLEVRVNGSWDTKDETAGAYKVYKDDNGKISSIVFDTVGTTGVNTNRYTIKYATPANPEWDSKVKNNTAAIDPPGDTPPIEDSGEATVPGEGNVVKTAKEGNLVTVDGKQLLEITWKTTVHVPTAGLPKDTVIEDTLADGQWMVWTQVQQWGSMLNASEADGSYVSGVNYWWPGTPGDVYDILLYTKDMSETNEPYHYSNIVSGSGVQDKQFTRYQIVFNSDVLKDYGGKEVWFEYKTYADVSTVTDTQKYQNTVSIQPPDGTKKESTASYDYKKAGVYKTDGNGNKESIPFTTKDGVLTWKVRVRTSKDCNKVTIVDTLPQGVTLTGIKLDNTNLTINETKISCDPMWSGNNKLVVSGAIEEKTEGDAITLTLSSADGSGNPVRIPARSEFYIYYTCKINPGVLNNMSADQATSFTNTVTAKQDDTEFPSDSHTQEVKYDKTETATKVVEKSGEWVNDSRLLDYSVVLNPGGEDLVEDADTLTMTDTLEFWTNSSTVSLIDTALLPGSVKLFKAYYDEEGNLQKGEEIKDWTWKVETKVEDKGWGVQHLSTITATVPDSTPMIFEYAYNVWLPDGSTTDKAQEWERPQVKNTVALTGVSDGSSSEESKIEWKETQTEAGIKYDHSLILYKVEQGNYGKTLPGAEFTLYDASKNQIGTYTTDSNGSFIIKWDETGKTFEHNKLYYLVETKAPDGYLMPDNPPEYCFYFSSTEDTTNRLPDVIPEGAVDLSTSEEQIYCENEKTTTSITVDKKWLASDGTTDITGSKTGSVTFDLYQIASTTPPSESGGGTGGSGTGTSTEVAFTLQHSQNSSTTMSPRPGVDTVDTVKIGDKVEISLTLTYKLGTGDNAWRPEVVVASGLENVEIGTWDVDTSTIKCTGTVTANDVVIRINTNLPSDIKEIVVKRTESATPTPTPTPTPEPGIVYKDSPYTINPNSATGWKYTIDDLPKQGTDEDGNTVYYTYYIKEHTGNYSTEYDNNSGIVSGTITVTNTESDNPGYELPATGGTGTAPLYTMGAALSVSAGLLLVHKKKRRKEGRPSS